MLENHKKLLLKYNIDNNKLAKLTRFKNYDSLRASSSYDKRIESLIDTILYVESIYENRLIELRNSFCQELEVLKKKYK